MDFRNTNRNEFLKPTKIYKYISEDIGKIIISDKTLKFSPPSFFNDPFDCNVNLLDFKLEGKINHRVESEIKALQRQFENMPGFKTLKNLKPFWEKIYRDTQLDKINQCKICCFSLINDNNLMWSHYADKHRGLCFEFDNLLPKRFKNLDDLEDITEGEVGYTAGQRINYMSEERQFAIYKLFMCKEQIWDYEKEFRMIIISEKKEIQKFSVGFLKGIYFGLKFPSEQIIQIKELCKLSGFTNLNFYIAQPIDLKINFFPSFS